jgi:hypothetical protein
MGVLEEFTKLLAYMGNEGARNGHLNIIPITHLTDIGAVVKKILHFFEGNGSLSELPEDIKTRVVNMKKVYNTENNNSKEELLTYMREYEEYPMHGGRRKRTTKKSKKSKSKKSKKSKKVTVRR